MNRKAFTIIELLVVVSIIALLIGILLPAIGKARDQARVTQSQGNMRNLATAHGEYGAEWADKQLSFIPDNISAYGNTDAQAFSNWDNQVGSRNEIVLGWHSTGLWILTPNYYSSFVPIAFPGEFDDYWGAFRLINAGNFSTYLNSRYYDPVFYAPKDKVVMNFVRPGLDSPHQFTPPGYDGMPNNDLGLPSYILSPAAMFNPDVLSSHGTNGGPPYYRNPWSTPAGFRTPSYSAAQFPEQKSHMLEHHWLQNSEVDCNPAFGNFGTYSGCEPYYFNSAWASVPVTLFYDGHIEGLGVREAELADSRSVGQTGHGLWSRDTGFGSDGYYIGIGFDYAATSYHILTIDGIKGRDKGSD
jgi:prepilin-type N-terminal cleavage/methylation domain-containing protein